jgi:hypothetical protein
MPDVIRVGPGYGKLWRGTASRPRQLRPRTVTASGGSLAQVSPRLGHQPRNVIPGEGTAVRVTAGCHRSASKVAGVPAGPDGERKPAIYAVVHADMPLTLTNIWLAIQGRACSEGPARQCFP